MSRVLQLKRGTKASLPSFLTIGELGYCTDTKELFVGNGVGNTLLDPLIQLNGSTGMMVKIDTGDDYAVRTIAEGTAISITNADGIAGNPTIGVNMKDEDDMSSDSDQHPATQQSIKAYVDSQITNILSQAGNTSISNGATSVVVSLPSSYVDTSYSISLSIINVTDPNPSQYGMVITAKSTTGFTITFSGVIDSANYSLEWTTNRSVGSVQLGSEDLSNGATSVTVTLPFAYTNTNYSIEHSILNTTDPNPSQYGMVITAKSTTGFTVLFSGIIDSANYDYEWTTKKF